MATTTTVYKLYTYPELWAAGVGFQCDTKEFPTFPLAQRAGRAANATMYEIQAVSTTVEPPTKKNPQGSTSKSAIIVERKRIRPEPCFAAQPTGLRIQYGINGYFTLKLSDADALRASVALRGLGLGLCWRPGRQMVTAKVSQLDILQKILVAEGMCRK